MKPTSSAGKVAGVEKTQYYTATTIDGYIADENHSLDWLFEVDRESDAESSFMEFFAGIGAMAMGATTATLRAGCSRTGRFRGSRERPSRSSRETSGRCTRR